ncbi:MAG: U32 family peptidase [Muribaculaceae bacterium]|nr:U32 family peptidase [Muribaculaceae bacterium]
MTSPRPIELLAPAANADIAIQAILHGADAVYIGPPSHGARKAASNSIEDIKRVVDFAHPFGARVYVTVNTIIYEEEVKKVERLISELYVIGVDAIIIQDLGILRMDIPPIALHASTQCDTRTPEKAEFLQQLGFSQIVLARELSISEIKSIADKVDVPLECFIHGALCVSYSGRCHASQEITGRSANRGECAQICRWSFNLLDADNKVIERNKHLLSLKDLNLSDRLKELLEAGVTSFKIEGRLKDVNYVKNIVALYRNRIDEIIASYPELYKRSSYGQIDIDFHPEANKSFNRGYTHYFLDSRQPVDISSKLTPKSMGELITDISQLHNGDGISFFNKNNEYEGMMVNGVSGQRVLGNKKFILPKNTIIHRTFDIEWQKKMQRCTAQRCMRLDIKLNDSHIEARDESDNAVVLPISQKLDVARNKISIRNLFDKFGNSIFYLGSFDQSSFTKFIPPSQLSEIRRNIINMMLQAQKINYKFDYRRKENPEALYISDSVDYKDNIANSLAEKVYREHGVIHIQRALEVSKKNNNRKVIMTTRHCILRELGKCLLHTPVTKRNFRLPLRLESGNNSFTLHFDCSNCQMEVFRGQ